MQCKYPRDGFRYELRGKVKVKVPCPRPCGKCIICKLEKARQWAMRCYHESQLYEENCFITLTFRCIKKCPEWENHHFKEDTKIKGRWYKKDSFIPGTECRYSLNKRDLQLFFKRLRKKHNDKPIRYMACGEYGENLGRRHYHAIIFNFDFKDKEVIYKANSSFYKNRFKKDKGDYDLYTSKELAEVWKYGYNTIGDVTLESAGYVARYCMKKITGDQAAGHYKLKAPEFALMSKGLGKDWLLKYWSDVYPKDFTTINGVKMKPPKYYDRLLEKKNPELLQKLKEKRREKAKESPEDRIRIAEHKEIITERQLQRRLN